MSESAFKPVAEVAAELGIPHRTIYNWEKARKLESRKVDGRTLVHVEAARALLARRDAAKVPASAGNPAAAGRQQANGTTSSIGNSRELTAKGIRALQEGARPEEFVHLGMLPDEALALTDSFEKLQAASMKPGSKLNARLEGIEQRLEFLAQDLGTGNFTVAGQISALQEQVEQLRSAMVQIAEWSRSLPVPAREIFQCSSCGTVGNVEMPTRCTHCGAVSAWGWRR